MDAMSHRGILIIAAILNACPAAAQFKNGNQSVVLDLPTLSQRAVVTQRIGLTDITVVYHRPQTGGRKIFGALVPYGRVWRAGANDNTTIEFHDRVTIEVQRLPPGRYGLHMIPAADQWTVKLSSNATSWGSFSYDPKEDVLALSVKPTRSDFHETLAYEFADLTPSSAVLAMRWENLAVEMHIVVDVHPLVLASIRNQLRSLPGYTSEAWNDAAMYCLDNGINYDEALTWADRSIEQDSRFDNMATKVRLLEAVGRAAEAAALFDKAVVIADAPQLYVYADALMKEQRRQEGVALFLRNVDRHPTSWIAIVGRARAEASKGDRAAARRSLADALARAPGDGQKLLVERMLARLDAGEEIS
jgi:tetratricopeptide (TPR) repeat protein